MRDVNAPKKKPNAFQRARKKRDAKRQRAFDAAKQKKVPVVPDSKSQRNTL